MWRWGAVTCWIRRRRLPSGVLVANPPYGASVGHLRAGGLLSETAMPSKPTGPAGAAISSAATRLLPKWASASRPASAPHRTTVPSTAAWYEYSHGSPWLGEKTKPSDLPPEVRVYCCQGRAKRKELSLARFNGAGRREGPRSRREAQPYWVQSEHRRDRIAQ